MAEVDSFGDYVRRELEHWGMEFALWRDFEYLGYCRKSLLQVLIDHRGEMPPPNVGYRPLETDVRAQRIEDIVTDIGRDQRAIACVMRAYYCGSGRRKVERLETANILLANAGEKVVRLRQYMALRELGEQTVRGALIGIARAG